MSQNQNETTEFGLRNAECGIPQGRWSSVIRHSAFTLVELLVVITIISILAGLITGAAIRALARAKQAAITLEIQQLSSAIEDFKNEYGAYPPNVFAGTDPALSLTTAEQTLNGQTLLRHLRKSFARSTEFNTASPPATPWNNNVSTIANTGLSPAEALVFWLQGFSDDVSRPLTGTDLEVTSIDDNGTLEPNVITIDSFEPRYDFDRGRLRISRDGPTRRFLTVNRANGDVVFIQLYEYLAPGSEEPFVYFDTSRETPEQVVNNWSTTEFFYLSPTSSGTIFPLKQMRADTPDLSAITNKLQFVEYVNRDKFQILHCGLDDAWGDFSQTGSLHATPNATRKLATSSDFIPQLLYPTGPFLGDIADTVGNFGEGTLEDAQE